MNNQSQGEASPWLSYSDTSQDVSVGGREYGSEDSGGKSAEENIRTVGEKQGRTEGICNGCLYDNTSFAAVYFYVPALCRNGGI